MSTRSGSAPRQPYTEPYAYQQYAVPQQQQHNMRAHEYNRQPVYAQHVEYVQLPPEYGHSPPQHQGRAPPTQYSASPPQPQPQRVFIDENGRQVFAVPIDDAPPPQQQQYSPNGYDPYWRAY